jgi:hypothetical protein
MRAFFCSETDEILLTGALGLITTLGARGWFARWGVPGPAPLGLPAPPRLIMPCCPAKNCGPAANALGRPGCAACTELGVTPAPLSPAGSGLLRESISCVVDDVGVAWAEPDGE